MRIREIPRSVIDRPGDGSHTLKTAETQETRELTLERLAVFKDTAEYCRKLQAEGRINSGLSYFINEQGEIKVRPLSRPEYGPDDLTQPAGLLPIMRTVLGNLQGFRYVLSTFRSREEWNTSSVGKLFRDLQEQMSDQIFAVRAYERTGDTVYNLRSIQFLIESINELSTLMLSPAFKMKWRFFQFRALNQFAEKFQERSRQEKLAQGIHERADQFILLDEYLQRLGRNPEFDRVVNTLLDKNIPELLKQYFGTVQTGQK